MDNLFFTAPRGIRNNNWLNIKYSPRSKWQGLKGHDGTFCIFETPFFGIRAANKILHNYLKSDPNIDVEHTIKKWCPDSTAPSYVRFVNRYTNILPSTKLSGVVDTYFFDLYPKFIMAMAFVECGENAILDCFGSRTDVLNIIKRGLSMKI